jgi:hypothetical protein
MDQEQAARRVARELREQFCSTKQKARCMVLPDPDKVARVAVETLIAAGWRSPAEEPELEAIDNDG